MVRSSWHRGILKSFARFGANAEGSDDDRDIMEAAFELTIKETSSSIKYGRCLFVLPGTLLYRFPVGLGREPEMIFKRPLKVALTGKEKVITDFTNAFI